MAKNRNSGGITGSGGKNVNPVYNAVPEKTITLNSSRTKVVTVDKNGNVTTRPFRGGSGIAGPFGLKNR